MVYFTEKSYRRVGGVLRSSHNEAYCNVTVNTASEFIAAIAVPFNIIWVGSNINLTGYQLLLIAEGVWILSDGKVISAQEYMKTSRDNAILFITGGPNIRIEGVNFIGCNPQILDQDWSRGFQGCFKVNHANFIMNNCRGFAWPTWFMWLNLADNAQIHRNIIEKNRGAGFGYGIWQGGAGQPQNLNATFIANRIGYTRHAIGSSGHKNSWEACYNLIYGTASNHNFDRHNGNIKDLGGKNTVIHHNVCLTDSRHFGLQIPEDEHGLVVVNSNYFAQPPENWGSICDSPWQMFPPHLQIAIGSNFSTLQSLPTDLKIPNIVPGTRNESLADRTLSFRFISSMFGAPAGKYFLQIILNDTIINEWDLRNKGMKWKLVKQYLPEGGKLSIRLFCKDPYGVVSCTVWIDNLQYEEDFNNFENGLVAPWKTFLTPKPENCHQINSGIKTDNAFQGIHSYSLEFGVGKIYQPGQFGELYRNIPNP